MSIDAIPRCDAPAAEVRGAELSHSLDDTTVGDVAMICVRDSAALIAIVDEQGRIVGTLRQDDILVPARWADEDDAASPR